ncbi:Short-chain dehydrogenase/reductase tropG [Madurella fahalii]|uniref:Short-chain dehydrogenase/reductase tropG n=1 Tax=Madurella fahalii TaxID=1157608 RepID=A0ABQ0GCZ9_9PEZI
MGTTTTVAIAVTITLILLTFGLPLLLAEFFPWRSLWKQKYGRPTVNTASYKGRTALITGANGAFGSRAAKIFARREVDTLVLVDVKDCTGVKEQIESELRSEGNEKKVPRILVWKVDMMSFKGCLELAKRLRELDYLDHALLTAGILSFDRKESPDGWETSIQINFLSTALIALLLLPALKSSPGNPNPPVLTFVTSFGVYPSSFTMSVPKHGSYLKRLSSNKPGMEQAHQYGRSKALLLYFARELAARSAALNVTINSADPGSAWTPLTNPNREQFIPRMIMKFAARDPDICAVALVNGVSAGGEGHGMIIQDLGTAEYPPFMTRKSGQVAQQRVWEETREELEAKIPEVRDVYRMLEAG